MSPNDKSTYAATAKELAESFAKQMALDYANSVSVSLADYPEPPDEDDFFAWLEGYSWTPSS